MPDQEKIISDLWPLDGPHSPGALIAAAETIVHLTRYMTAAMGPGAKADVVADPADAYAVLGSLVDADMKMSEFLARLGHWSDYVGARSMHTDEYGLEGGDGTRDEIEDTTNKVTAHLRNSASKHVTSAEVLNLARTWLQGVYRVPGDVGPAEGVDAWQRDLNQPDWDEHYGL